MNLQVTITFSKLMALIIIVLSFIMDFYHNKAGTVFMFAIPFAVFLITGKQFFDRGKEEVK